MRGEVRSVRWDEMNLLAQMGEVRYSSKWSVCTTPGNK